MKVIIIGAGIGGLTLAIALQQQGIPYVIYEAASGNKAVGAGIMIGTNAMKVYMRLGVSAALEKRGILADHFFIRDYKDKILKAIDNRELETRFGHGGVSIHRASLQDELLNAVHGPVQWGKKCVSVEQSDTQVSVHFEDGSSDSGEVLIGADGIRSVVRELCIEPAQYRYSGQTCWRATIPIDLPAEEQKSSSERWGAGNGLRAMYGQVGPQQVYFWMTVKRPAGSVYTPEAALSFIKTSLQPFEGYMQTVLRHLTADTLIHTDLYDIKPLSRWYKGHIALLGDAAHATTPNLGQGASQAIEDAYILARCLSAHPTPSAAFAAYQRKRMQRARKVVSYSRSLAMLTNLRGRLAVWCRNALMKHAPARMSEQQMRFLYDVNLDL
jgi:2-polyprenyl-6-methoxyphenol hydroxylase-like FAD-dependent oxidoreductase